MDLSAPVFLNVPAAEVCAVPETYSFSWPAADRAEDLRESVARWGVLRPLLAIATDGRLTVVAGARRREALGRSRARDVPLRLVAPVQPAALWDLLLEDQLLGGPLNVVEVGLYARKRLDATGERPEELAASLLPRLGLAPRSGALEDALWASGLPDLHKASLVEGAFPPQGLRVLARAPREDALAVLELLGRAKAGVNRFLEVAKHVLECAWREGLPVPEWLRREGLAAPTSQEGLESLRRQVRKRRFPTISAWEESFPTDVRALGLRRARVSHAPGFEGRLTCSVSFASLEELRGGAEELLAAEAAGTLDPLSKYLE